MVVIHYFCAKIAYFLWFCKVLLKKYFNEVIQVITYNFGHLGFLNGVSCRGVGRMMSIEDSYYKIIILLYNIYII